MDDDDDNQKNQNLHFLLFPLFQQGHMIPMVDIAKLIAHRGHITTIVTTPQNASRVEDNISETRTKFGLKIHQLQIEYPSFEDDDDDDDQISGFSSKGIESMDMLSSLGKGHEFMSISNSILESCSEKFFLNLKPKPNCIISDSLLPFTSDLATKLKVPRIAFQGFSCFFNVIQKNMYIYKPEESVNSETEFFSIPGLPDEIKMSKAQLPQPMPEKLKDYQMKIFKAEIMDSYGLIVNGFEEYEPYYVNEVKDMRKKAWCIGPVSLCSHGNSDKAQRGNKASIDENECLKWLDSQKPISVIYICFGSMCNLIPEQLIELGLALESSKHPFIWVIKKGNQDLEKWIQEHEFESKIKEKGLLIRGWAPQVLILPHPSIGSFITHCGWNSILEGVSAGVPMITWPRFADQFLNEKQVVDVLKVGVGVGAELPVNWGFENKYGVSVKKEKIRDAIDEVMNESEEARGRRRRARELSEMAKRAMEEGGSSYVNLTKLIDDIKEQAGVSS